MTWAALFVLAVFLYGLDQGGPLAAAAAGLLAVLAVVLIALDVRRG